MKPSNEQIRFYVETRRQLGIKPCDIYDELTAVWGKVKSFSTVYRYAQNASDGIDTLVDGRPGNSGRIPSATSETQILKVKELINNDNKISIECISQIVGISTGSVFTIIHEKLKLKSIAVKWIPYELSEGNKERRVDAAKHWKWIIPRKWESMCFVDEKIMYLRSIGKRRSNRCWIGASGDESQSQRVGRSQFDKKVMIMAAVTFTGKFHIEVLKAGETVDSQRYCIFLRHMITKFSRHVNALLCQDILLVQDNARPHTSAATTTYLDHRGLKLLHQPQYSPDFNILDRYVFSVLEDKRASIDFEDGEDVHSFVADVLKAIPFDQWEHQKEKLLSDLTHIINCGGNYL